MLLSAAVYFLFLLTLRSKLKIKIDTGTPVTAISLNNAVSALFGQINVDNLTLTVTDCAVIGSLSISSDGGSILGGTSGSTSGCNITISSCYSTLPISGSASGGIVGYQAGNSGTITISECYTTGNTTVNRTGGIAGGQFAQDCTSQCKIINCYSVGNITGGESGGIVGRACGDNSTGGVLIKNCYSFGELLNNGGGITGLATRDTVSIEYCFARGAADTGSGAGNLIRSISSGTITPTNVGVGNGGGTPTWGDPLGNSFLTDNDGEGNTNVWISDGLFSSGYGLTAFNESPWDVDTSYTTHTSEAAFAQSGGAGDPHITTVMGKVYYLSTPNTFLFFDNNHEDESKRVIINAGIRKGQYQTWDKKEYIDRIYIKNGNDRCMIRTGFRGEPCTIEGYEGTMDVNIVDLNLKQGHKKFCKDCRFKSRDTEMIRIHTSRNKHQMIPSVRNRIICKIKTDENMYTVVVENINVDNFRPSSVSVRLSNKSNISKYLGAIVREDCWDIPNLYSY